MTYLIKEWKEQTRGKGLWLAISMVAVISLFVLLESRSLPPEHGFTIFLLSLYEMNVFLIPLISLFIASFALMQEKELKTLMILTTKKESYSSFLFKKSLSIQLITIGVFVSWFFVLAVLAKATIGFNSMQFLAFLVSTIVFLLIFNQIGLLLGTICKNRMQLVGATIFTWFLFVFLLDLIFLYFLPTVTHENVQLFSIFFFLDPLHANQFFLETSLDMFSLEHMSRLMDKMVWATPSIFVVISVLFWVGLSFGLASLWKGQVETK